jgi:hypothetical protein
MFHESLNKNSGTSRSSATIADEYRKQIFKTMLFEDAEMLRRTKGRFADTYQAEIRKGPNESHAAFSRRRKLNAMNFSPRYRRYR